MRDPLTQLEQAADETRDRITGLLNQAAGAIREIRALDAELAEIGEEEKESLPARQRRVRRERLVLEVCGIERRLLGASVALLGGDARAIAEACSTDFVELFYDPQARSAA
jgi:hypothetical protein